MRALLVECRDGNARTVAGWLRVGNISAQPANHVDDAVEFLRAYHYDIAIIGNLPANATPAGLVRHVRRLKIGTPAVVVSGVADHSAKVEAFDAGADDYVTTPIDRDEFLARIRAVIRRANGFAEPVLRAGSIEVELGAREARVHGRPVRLTAMEFSVMELLLLRRGMVLSKAAFLNHLYGGIDEPDAKIIDVFVCKLRKKLAQAGSASVIETIRGQGYVLRERPSTATEATRAGASS
jgi:two-component system cell cycle response regulator CtrA